MDFRAEFCYILHAGDKHIHIFRAYFLIAPSLYVFIYKGQQRDTQINHIGTGTMVVGDNTTIRK